MSRLIRPAPGDLILEIGAGDGALSRHLAEGASRLLALEIDEDCIDPLQTALAPFPFASVVRRDILETDIISLVSPYLNDIISFRVTGNLPYNISTAIIEKILRLQLPVSDIVFMLQLEVAQRITAEPATRQYGYFSVLCQHLAEVQMAFRVAPACFSPRPRVFSAIIQLWPFNIAHEQDFEDAFTRLTRAAFAYRRKMLSNALSRDPGIGTRTGDLLCYAGIDGSRRAEELSVQDYERLARCFLTLDHRIDNPGPPQEVQ